MKLTMEDILIEELKQFDHPVDILETGTIRTSTPISRHGFGWSTLTFAEHVAEHGGNFTSIDLDTRESAKVLRKYGVQQHVNLIQSDSVLALSNLDVELDFVLLDSADDSQLTWTELLTVAPLVRPGGTVLFDDVALEGCTGRKGDVVMKWLADNDLPHREYKRWGGWGYIGMIAIDDETMAFLP